MNWKIISLGKYKIDIACPKGHIIKDLYVRNWNDESRASRRQIMCYCGILLDEEFQSKLKFIAISLGTTTTDPNI